MDISDWFLAVSLIDNTYMNCLIYRLNNLPHIGALHWVWPPARAIRVADTNMLVSEKPCRPNPTPNASLECPTQAPTRASGIWFRIGYVRIWVCVVCPVFIALGTGFLVEYGLNYIRSQGLAVQTLYGYTPRLALSDVRSLLLTPYDYNP